MALEPCCNIMSEGDGARVGGEGDEDGGVRGGGGQSGGGG